MASLARILRPVRKTEPVIIIYYFLSEIGCGCPAFSRCGATYRNLLLQIISNCHRQYIECLAHIDYKSGKGAGSLARTVFSFQFSVFSCEFGLPNSHSIARPARHHSRLPCKHIEFALANISRSACTAPVACCLFPVTTNAANQFAAFVVI